MTTELNYWAVVPAAGVGKRMKSTVPKQYLPLAGSTVLETTLSRLLSHEKVAGIVVALSANDAYWPELDIARHEKIHRVDGGKERSDSVLNALKYLATRVDPATRVLVHDAARPCVSLSDISLLIDKVADSDDGGLLGVPVRDTMKRTDGEDFILETLDRENLWHAFTPQMFPLGLLMEALDSASLKQQLVTDDASAMELLGYQPLMVEGRADNIKITRPEDLPLAEFFIQKNTN